MVDIEHEEVALIPRYIPCKRVTFKYGLGEKFINVIKVIKMLGITSKRTGERQRCEDLSDRSRGSLPAQTRPLWVKR